MKPSKVSSLATRALSMPVASGVELVARSLKDGKDKALVTPLLLPVSSCSADLASASFHSPVSDSRASFQLLVALVVVTEIDLSFSALNQSLFNHSSGFASALLKGSVTSATL